MLLVVTDLFQVTYTFFFFFNILFIYLFLVALCLHCLGGYSLVRVLGLLILCYRAWGLGVWASVVVGHRPSCPMWDLLGSSRTRDSTWVLCSGRWILNHWWWWVVNH